MRQLLEQINTLPGVVGSFVRSEAGEVLAHAFPPLFDVSIFQEAADALTEIVSGPNGCVGPDLIDFRFAESRILIRPLAAAQLLLLCSKDVNLQVLNISLNVAIKKLEKLVGEAPVAAEPMPVVEVATPAAVTSEVDGLFLEVGSLVPAEANKGFEQLGMVAINQATAHRISNHFGVGTVKKANLLNPASGKEGLFPLMIVNDDDNKYDGKLILGKSIEKKLATEIGDRLQVKL
jgi:hypothetical protein